METLPSTIRSFLRSHAVGLVWVAVALFSLLLLLQQVTGGLVRKAQLPLEKANTPGGPFWTARLPMEKSAWDGAFVKVLKNGQSLRRWPNTDELERSGKTGWALRGRSVEVRLSSEMEGSPPSGMNVVLPRFLSSRWMRSIGAILTLLTALVVWSRNPVLFEGVHFLRKAASGRGGVWLLALLALVAVSIPIAVRARAFAFPAIAPDTWQYLEPGLEFSSTGHLHSQPDRPLGYPLLLGIFLHIRPDFLSLVRFQGWGSIFVGLVLAWLVWDAARGLFPRGVAPCAAGLLGIAAMLLFTCNEAILEREWQVLPEAFAAVYLVIELLLLRALFSHRTTPAAAALIFALFCVVGWLVCLTKPNWGLAVLCLPLPWMVAGAVYGIRSWGRRKWFTVGACIFLGIGMAALGLQKWSNKEGAVESLEIRGRALVCWHAPLIHEEIDRRLASGGTVAHREILLELRRIIEEEFKTAAEKGPGSYPALGYDGDRIFYGGFDQAVLYHALPRREQTQLCRSLFFSAVRHHPLEYVRKVARQMSIVLRRPYGPVNISRPTVLAILKESDNFLASSFPLPTRLREGLGRELQTAHAEFPLWPSGERLGWSIRVSILHDLLRDAFVWIVGCSILVVLAGALLPPWRHVIGWRRLVAPLCAGTWAVGSAAGSALTSSAAQAIEVQRYIDLFWPLSLFAQCIWPIIAAAVMRDLFLSRRVESGQEKAEILQASRA